MSVMAQLHADRCAIDRVLGTQRRDIAVASLVGECEAIAASGRLTEPAERSLRLLIAETLSAFNMEPHQEAVRTAMGRKVSRPPICEGCGINRSDPPSTLCPGCQAYREHQS